MTFRLTDVQICDIMCKRSPCNNPDHCASFPLFVALSEATTVAVVEELRRRLA